MDSKAAPWVGLAVILMLAAGLRVAYLDSTSLRLDELWSIALSAGRGSVHLALPTGVIIEHPPDTTQLEGSAPWWRVWTTQNQATHPPLYYLVLRVWRNIFGGGDLAARSLSVVLGLAAIAVLFDMMRRLHGPGPALWACALFAVAQTQIEHAQVARNYTLLLFLALFAGWAIIRIEREGAKPFLLTILGLALLLTMLTHYFAAGTLAGLFIYAMLRTRSRARWAVVGVFAAAAIVYIAVWGSFLLEQRARFRVDDPIVTFLLDREPGHALRVLLYLLALPLRLLMDPPAQLYPYAAISGVLYVLPLIFVRRHPQMGFWWLWLLATVLPLALFDFARSTNHPYWLRYPLLAGPAVYALLAATTWCDAGFARHLLPILAIVACLLGLPAAYVAAGDYRVLAQVVDSTAAPGELLVFATPQKLEWTGGERYLGYSHYSKSPRRPILILPDMPSPAILELLRSRSPFCLIKDSPASVSQIFPDSMATGGPIDGFYPPEWRPIAPAVYQMTPQPRAAP